MSTSPKTLPPRCCSRSDQLDAVCRPDVAAAELGECRRLYVPMRQKGEAKFTTSPMLLVNWCHENGGEFTWLDENQIRIQKHGTKFYFVTEDYGRPKRPNPNLLSLTSTELRGREATRENEDTVNDARRHHR